MTAFRKLAGLLGLVMACSVTVDAFQNLFTPFANKKAALPRVSNGARKVEDDLLSAINQVGSRLDNSELIQDLVQKLEQLPSISEPAIAPQVYGRWRLLYTTNTDTSSPIQRKAVDTQKFAIYQDIVVNDKNQLQVNQVVKFSDTAQLSVDALASTSAYPLAEFTERKSTGKILGLNILGVSVVGEEAKPDPNRPNSRIDFVFDEGNFDFGNVKIPYPVPFRLPILRDTVKGWIDITYLSDRVRIARGNKGTTFILAKEDESSD
eukprot:scaffold3408_cov129-Amphora_coffeaeformis.AAC.4